MERGLLSDQKLAEFHDKVVWMYLYQDFSDSPADRKAQRVAIRFGISMWPQHFLVDPYTLDVIGSTGRSLASFSNAVERAKVSKRNGDSLTNTALRAADARATDLEKDLTADTAKAALKDEDSVVRLRALQFLQNSQPEAITAAATELLAVANDHVRFLICKVLEESGSAEHEEILASLVRDPAGSKNPNVLRIRAVQALATCGEQEAIKAIRPFAVSGEWFNGLTGVSVDTLATIGHRSNANRDAVRKILSAAYPVPPDMDDTRQTKACRALALRVHQALTQLTGKTVPFPEVYDKAVHAELSKAW